MSIKIERTDKELSANAGLIILKELVDASGIDLILSECLPKLKLGLARNIRKFRQLMFGFQAGADCLDDFEKLAKDQAFKAICGGKSYGPKALGDFLRLFSEMHCKNLNYKLIQNAFQLRRQLVPDAKSITIDIDSTTNQQYGRKMEGVCSNYAGIVGLDTICAFDENGIQYWSDVRPGNTHTATGALEIIHEIFNRMPEPMAGLERRVRADSGYCKRAFFEACDAKDATFVVCMRRLMYKPLIKTVTEWQSQDLHDPDRILFVGGRECEIGETIYQPKNSPHRYRVVLIRAVKKGREDQFVLGDDDYDYLGWITSLSDTIEAVGVVKLYRKRGHAENFIRELKNGLDLHHYPCQKLLANKAYGLCAALAYNYMRFIAVVDNPKHPQFAKALRFRFIHLPCQVVRHAGQVIFRFMQRHYEEVNYWIKKIKQFDFGLRDTC